MRLRSTARLMLWACGICAVVAAVGLRLGISGDNLTWISVSIAGSLLAGPLLVVAVILLVVAGQRERGDLRR